MNIIKELLKNSKWLIAFAIFASVCSALASIMVISMINEMISSPDVSQSMAIKGIGFFFAFVCHRGYFTDITDKSRSWRGI